MYTKFITFIYKMSRKVRKLDWLIVNINYCSYIIVWFYRHSYKFHMGKQDKIEEYVRNNKQCYTNNLYFVLKYNKYVIANN